MQKNKGIQTPTPRGLFGLVLAACLNLALQPCAMAMGGEQERDCPHCPPSDSQDHRSHHATAPGDAEQPRCALADTDCGLGDEFNYDGRSSQVKLKESPSDTPLAISNPFDHDAVVLFVDPAVECPTRGPPSESRPPLNVLYCSYLN